MLRCTWPLLAWFCVWSSASQAWDDYRRISEFHHTAWTSEQGAPGDTWAIVQSADGWLWLGGPRGLFRFDGVQFEQVEIEGRNPNDSIHIYTLFAEDSGDLWIGYLAGGVSRLKNGTFQHFGVDEGLPRSSVTAFARDSSGKLWVATFRALLNFDGERWRTIGPEMGVADLRPLTLHVDQQGTLWMGDEKGIFYLRPGDSQVRPTQLKTKESVGFLQSPDGRSWYEDALGAHLLPNQKAGTPRSRRANSREPLGGMFDGEGNFWAVRGTLRRQRVPPESVAVLFDYGEQADRFGEQDGASGQGHSLIEDQEGNIWNVTSGGLDRYRRTNVRKLGLPGGSSMKQALAPAEHGAIWIGLHYSGDESAPNEGLWRYDGLLTRVAAQTINHVSALDRDARGTLWIAGQRGVWHLKNAAAPDKLPALPAPAQGQTIHLMAVDATGAPWISALRSSLYGFKGGAWHINGTVTALPAKRPHAYARDPTGNLWFGYSDNRIVAMQPNRIVEYDRDDGLDLGVIDAISVGHHTIVAGPRRVAILDGNRRFHLLTASNDAAALEGVTGIVETERGDVWLNGFRGAVRIDGSDLDRALQTASYTVPLELFDIQDGFPGMGQSVRPVPTLVQGTDGRLWFAATLGTGWLHPEKILRNGMPPPVHIRAVIAGGQTHPVHDTVRLPKGTQDLQINYTALSLSRPELVQFRYRLEGYDQAWIDAGQRRQAFYTNMSPGDYRFRVVAANESGVWNETGASMSIVIPPLFTQTKTFLALCVLATLAVMWGAYRLRVNQITARVRGRLEERLGERERIARELHDTLLQGVQGLILRFQTVADQIEAHDGARSAMTQALDRADALLIEGRDRVKNLRSATLETVSLRQTLVDAAEQVADDHNAAVRVIENGTQRELHPVVREEAARIATEAMLNALHHSGAKTIEVEISYERRQLRINVRDDGRGMDESVTRTGREGHFGFMGMHERAKRIRARLSIWSRPGAGTEVNLLVPANMAYIRNGRERQLARELRE